MATLQQTADKLQKSSRTIQRWISTGQQFPEWVNITQISPFDNFSPTDELPDKLYSWLVMNKKSPKPPFEDFDILTAEETKQEHGSLVAGRLREFRELSGSDKYNLNGQENKPAAKTKSDKKVVRTDPTNVTLLDKVLHGDSFPAVAMFILILSDSFSCGWIAWHSFDKFIPAVVFFSLVGFAVAFSSIKNAVGFDGWESNTWLWSFGAFQFLLHMSAFKMFEWISDGASMALGIFVICISIPMGTIGIAITYKKRTK